MFKAETLLKYIGFFLLLGIIARCVKYDVDAESVTLEQVIEGKPINHIKPTDKENVFTYNLCQSIKIEWDSIAVIRPYIDNESITGLDLPFFSKIRNAVKTQSADDKNYTLLFRSGGKYVGYATLPHTPLNFTTYRNSNSETITWIKKNNCNLVLAKKELHGNLVTYHILNNYK